MRHACPVCGNEVVNTCYHDGADVSAVDMPEERWRTIRRGALDEWIAEAEDAVEALPGLKAEREALG